MPMEEEKRKNKSRSLTKTDLGAKVTHRRADTKVGGGPRTSTEVEIQPHERGTNNGMPLLCGGLRYFVSEGQLVLGVKQRALGF